jgi:predicted anti-sigma-YlaC factor YlaD
MKDACQRYLEDPEANAGHLAECEECRALFDTLGLAPPESMDERPISVGALPLAPWEGATHRPWALIAGGIAVVAIGLMLCIALGVRPLALVQQPLVSMVDAYGQIGAYASALREASIVWQIAFGVVFVVINAVLVLLLRRAPRGIDA